MLNRRRTLAGSAAAAALVEHGVLILVHSTTDYVGTFWLSDPHGASLKTCASHDGDVFQLIPNDSQRAEFDAQKGLLCKQANLLTWPIGKRRGPAAHGAAALSRAALPIRSLARILERMPTKWLASRHVPLLHVLLPVVFTIVGGYRR